MDELRKLGGSRKVMFAVDEYNALFGGTDMHEVLGARKRGNIAAGSTRVVAALRDTARLVDGGATFVAAVSQTIQMSPANTAKLGPDAAALTALAVPRLTTKEVFSMAGCCNFKPVLKAPVFSSHVTPLSLSLSLLSSVLSPRSPLSSLLSLFSSLSLRSLRLKPKHYKLLSRFAFNFKVRPYSTVKHYDAAAGGLGSVHDSVNHETLTMRLKALTQGNAKEIREMCSVL